MVTTHKILTDRQTDRQTALSCFAAKINTAFQKRHILPII